MESIEEIQALFSELQPAELALNRWHVKPVPSIGDSRIMLSIDAQGGHSLFLKGPLSSFGRLPSLAGMEHNENATDAQTGETFPALRISAPGVPPNNAAVAHIVYEFIRHFREDPEVDNASLLVRVNWILEILGHRGAPMSPPNQRGLVAECLLLGQLLTRGRELQVGPEATINKWVRGRRDFAGGGIAVEVKATASTVRTHHIGSLGQLETDDDAEKVFIYSVGIRHDPSAPRTLPDYINAVMEQLVSPNGKPMPAAREAFEEKLASAGYDSTHEGLYRSGEGILQSTALPPRLFQVEGLGRLTINSFKNDELPPGVVGVSYELEIVSPPLSFGELNGVLASMLLSGG